MAINIKHPEAEAVLRRIAKILNLPMSQAAVKALKYYEMQLQRKNLGNFMADTIAQARSRRAQLGIPADQAQRDLAELYDEDGLPA